MLTQQNSILKRAEKVVVEITKDTHIEIYYFSTGNASYGNKIVVGDWDTWGRKIHLNGEVYTLIQTGQIL